ncbi:MAG: hypothetical protein KDB22_07720 [Planctomycetales bacterium]|nr:hypothetical protein [Planctomycetales bacterium]
MKKQKTIGVWTTALGQLLLVAMLVLCVVDIAGLQARGQLLIPLAGYLSGIFTGVAMQFLGAAIPNMRFSGVNYEES